MTDYRAPTPATLTGARVIGTSEAERLWRARTAAFVDVLPRPPRPAGLPPDVLWRDPPHDGVPGSLWLANVGYGLLHPDMEDYFRAGLKAATHGRRDAALVIFCQRNCWMSWNAAKRALGYGYTNVAWFPEGTDGWRDAGLPLERVEPRR